MKHILSLKLDETILKLLPEELRQNKHSQQFPAIASEYLRDLFGNLDGTVQSVSASSKELQVTWIDDEQGQPAPKKIVDLLHKNEYPGAALLMEFFLVEHPNDTGILYDLGMAYSDMGVLYRSVTLLKRLLELEPDNINGRVALGVALTRQGKKQQALVELEKTVSEAPDNPWARRNLGAILGQFGKMDEAVPHFREATRLNPSDQLSWYGLAQALESTNRLEEADKAYRETINADEFSEIAENAKKGLSRIAGKTFQSATPGIERMDAVMYCLGAMEKFDKMPLSEVQKIGFEIATVGMNGLDVNNSEQKYHLKNLPGSFSGLHLVSMMYVAFQKIAPAQDIGFDLSKEYRLAQELYQARNK